jgi:hypothetical protein
MRAFVDIVENLTSSIRYVIGAIVLGIMAVGLFMTMGAAYVGQKAVDSMGERVERLSEDAIRAELESRRAQELGKDGWGYRPINKDVDKDTATAPRDPESAKNGWGD